MNPLLQSIWMLSVTALLIWILRIVSNKEEDVVKNKYSLINYALSYASDRVHVSVEINCDMICCKFWIHDHSNDYHAFHTPMDIYFSNDDSRKLEIDKLVTKLKNEFPERNI